MRNLAGKRFGRLAVVEATDGRLRDQVLWHCVCDCGNELDVPTSSLTRGFTQSCGCLKTDVRTRDLAGRRFGRLTAVRPTDKRDRGSVVWECACDCGNTCEAPSPALTGGRVTSCGCEDSDAGKRARYKDLAGRRFGKLVAVRPVGRSKGGVVWECKCDCGNMKEVRSSLLVSGKTRSCGCMQGKPRNREVPESDLAGRRFGKLVAVERIGARNGSPLWRCQCDCGLALEATSRELTGGLVTDCGCGQEKGTVREGNRFGQLIVIGPTSERKDGSPVWRCACDCDNVVYATEADLLAGNLTSCGHRD